MNLDSINRRLDKLVARHPTETPRRVIQLIVEGDEGETSDQAFARWHAENPDHPHYPRKPPGRALLDA